MGIRYRHLAFIVACYSPHKQDNSMFDITVEYLHVVSQIHDGYEKKLTNDGLGITPDITFSVPFISEVCCIGQWELLYCEDGDIVNCYTGEILYDGRGFWKRALM